MSRSPSSIALGNLRGVVIVIVVAFHSALAYLAYLPQAPYAFDSPPYQWQAIPIIDSHRWFGFDLFCAWQDVSLMSLMFFLSGVFVPGSLARKGSRTFFSDRLLRIGMPLALVVALLIPMAYYPSYRIDAADPSVAAFWRHWLALPFWPPGPQWFLWDLLVLNVVAAAVYQIAPRWHERLSTWMDAICDRPVRFFVGLVIVSALAYVPLALIFTPWSWFNYGPFSFQLSRPLHYFVYFFAGYLLGAYGLDRGLLAAGGALSRRWAIWLGAAVAGFVVWALPTSHMLGGRHASLIVQVASGTGFALACAAGCFFFLAVCLRFATAHNRAFGSLSTHAYNMYLLHYVFVVWLQYAMLGVALFAVGKWAVVFGIALLMSWGLAAMLSSISPAALLAQSRRWLGAGLGAPAPAKILKQDDLSG